MLGHEVEDLCGGRPHRRRSTVSARPVNAPVAERPALRVLLVEDYEDTRKIYSTYLGHVGMDVLTAADGVEGIAKARAFKPDLIVMDLGLPGMDGLEAARHLKADPVTSAIPIIALTAFVFSGRLARAAGCDAFVAKPCMFDRLVQLIWDLTAGARQPLSRTDRS
jgi:CheY-like chemotaxis protein